MLPAIKAHAQGPAKAYYQMLVRWADRECKKRVRPGDWGRQAAALAVLHLLTNDPRYLRAAKERLEKSVAYYRQRGRAGKAVSWYSTTRINAICAYDWLYNHLSVQERLSLARDLLAHTAAVQPIKDQKPPRGRNISDHTSGFYGTPSLLWYVGLATYQSGANDGLAKQFMAQGYADHIKLLKYRRHIGGQSGAITYTLNYALGAYPNAEFNFFHTMKSAFGQDLAKDWPYPANLASYILWNRLPGNLWFGSGDAYHQNNRLPEWQTYTHLAQIRHFYGQARPGLAALAAWLQMKLSKRKHSIEWPAIPLLLTGEGQAPPAKGPAGLDLPLARHFKNLGQVFMRSGWGKSDTYALFTGGGISSKHKHFDENSFVIYRQGFLALDTGSRPEMVSVQASSHTLNYYPRTIAHNSMLIYMPGEKMPSYWGMRADPTPNGGGQRLQIGGKIIAFETRPAYTYLAGDATGVYHPDKCSLALRQFLFIPPRHFVVFDRVVSRQADYKKTWLLHLARKPRIVGDFFQAEQAQGSIFCQTLLPRTARLSAVGGPGRQFMNGGRNWPLPKGYKIANDHELLGQWRVEVSPSQPAESDLFLHLIEVGSSQGKKPNRAKLVTASGQAGVEFTSGDLQVKVMFATKGPASGAIEYKKGGQRFKRSFTSEVQDQSGL